MAPCPKAQTRSDIERIRAVLPDRVPVIVERYHCEKLLPVLDRPKYLVPDDLTVGEFSDVIRQMLRLHKDQEFYLFVNQINLTGGTKLMMHLYDEEMDEDGFLYAVFASYPSFDPTVSNCFRS